MMDGAGTSGTEDGHRAVRGDRAWAHHTLSLEELCFHRATTTRPPPDHHRRIARAWARLALALEEFTDHEVWIPWCHSEPPPPAPRQREGSSG